MKIQGSAIWAFALGVFVTAAASFFIFGGEREEKSVFLPFDAASREESGRQELQQFALAGYDNQGQKFWNLKGDVAKINTDRTVFLDQNVSLELENNTTIEADHVEFSQEKGILRTNAPVFISHQNAKIRGIGAIGKLNEKFVQIQREIDMVISDTTHLVCRGPMKIYYDQNKIIFYRDVKVTDEKGTLAAQRMDVFMDPEQKKVSEIHARGDVVITRGGSVTHSDRAIYTVATGSVKLEGSPKILLQKDNLQSFDGTFRN